MHLSPPPPVALAAVRYKAVILFLLIRCCLLLQLWDSVTVLCVVVRYFVSILGLQSSRWDRESWLLCVVCLLVSRDCCMFLTIPRVCLQFGLNIFYLYTLYIEQHIKTYNNI